MRPIRFALQDAGYGTSINAPQTVVDRQDVTALEPYDLPAELPRPRGPMTAALLDYLRCDPASTRVDPTRLTWTGGTAEAATDHDLQLALWLAYELPYRGLAGVDDAWERHRGLIEVIEEWEDLLLDALVSVTCGVELAEERDTLARAATPDQFRELLVHRSVYYVKESEPHTCGIPVTGALSAQLFRSLLTQWGLSTRYGHYLDCVPGITLLTSNMISLFGLHRRFRGALAGHLGELTRSIGDPEPPLRDGILFGARCAAYANEQFAAWVMPRWAAGQSSLLQEFGDPAA